MAIIQMSDEAKIKLIRDVVDDWTLCKINDHQAVLIVSGILTANADVTPLVGWLNDKSQQCR